MPVCGTLCALTLSLCAAPVGAVWKYASKNVGTAAQALDAGAEGGTAGGLASILGRDTAYVRLQPSKSAEELKKRSREALILRQHDLLHANNITMIATEKVDRKDYKIRLQDHKTQFTGAISIGTPGQSMNCIFDTGSSMIWVFSTLCKDQLCDSHKLFEASKSSTLTEGKEEMTITFGTGSLIGQTAKDTINLGGIKIENQTFGEIEKPVGQVWLLDFDGICGLSFPMADKKDQAFLTGLQKAMENPKFSFYFDKEESALIFGEPPEALLQRPPEYYPLTREFYWETELKDVKIGGKSILREDDSKNLSAVFDSGTSVLTMPTEHVVTAMAMLREAGVSCSQIEAGTAPKICYSFEGKADICVQNWYEMSDSSCTASLMTLDLNREDIFILGQPFFNENVVTFDAQNDKVGVSPKKTAVADAS